MRVEIVEKSSKCCPDITVFVRRKTADIAPSQKSSIIFSTTAYSPESAEYKALAYKYDVRGKYNVKRVGLVGSSSPIGQAIQSIGSYALPGNLSPLRSPIRSGVFGALTPGMPGFGGGGINRRERTARCPEGYQYGGRFADNELSNCGAKLFDLPGPLGAAIGALRRIAEREMRALAGSVEGRPITPGEYDDIINGRRPQIPRVGETNRVSRAREVAKLVGDMGAPNVSAARLVRRDGFVLEPVVTPKVLRTIPDNRDMEDATYLMTANSVEVLGGEELGLLSNTGVSKLVYVLPGGSSLTLEKVRTLTVGERRKLGRTVNASANLDNSKNPVARLINVATETGDGMKYTENFVGIDNPNEMVTGRDGRATTKWVKALFGRQRKPKAPERQSASNAGIGAQIETASEAAQHIVNGGSLSDIPAEILAEALKQANLFKRLEMRRGLSRVFGQDNHSYWERQPTNKYDAINARFISDIQQHLGLQSPDVFPVGKGDSRAYLYQTSDIVYPGTNIDTSKSFNDVGPKDAAALMVSDFISGIDNRSPGTLDIMPVGGEYKPVVNTFESQLTPLAEIKVRQNAKNTLESFKNGSNIYSAYYKQLKAAQRRQFLAQIEKLIEKARAFNFINYRERLSTDGSLTTSEKQHLNIINTIYKQRVEILSQSMDRIRDILGG